MKVYHATCQITAADSGEGFWAWGRVTINLVKSADESLSHRYNQRHSRPLFPRRNSCFLWHVLKFYFKNSQHLKAECVRSPGLPLQCVFGFLNRITMFLGLMLLPSPDPHTEGCGLTPCDFLLSGGFGISTIMTLEEVLFFSPLIFQSRKLRPREEMIPRPV